MSRTKGYLLPTEVSPPDDVCIRVYVPNDVRYIEAFWGSYEFLSRWLAWEEDSSHTGKLAAARFFESFLTARE
jgi:hypothetical protein